MSVVDLMLWKRGRADAEARVLLAMLTPERPYLAHLVLTRAFAIGPRLRLSAFHEGLFGPPGRLALLA